MSTSAYVIIWLPCIRLTVLVMVLVEHSYQIFMSKLLPWFQVDDAKEEVVDVAAEQWRQLENKLGLHRGVPPHVGVRGGSLGECLLDETPDKSKKKEAKPEDSFGRKLFDLTGWAAKAKLFKEAVTSSHVLVARQVCDDCFLLQQCY